MDQKTETLQDERVDIAKQIGLLWTNRWWIAGGTFLFSAIGLLYAFLAPSVWESGAIISLKENQKASGASSVLSQLGGFGGMIAAQLGGANTNLDKLEIILKGEELALNIIREHDLMPILFPAYWDEEKGAWKAKDSSGIPDIRYGVDMLRNDITQVTTERIKNLLNLRVKIYDPVIAKRIVEYYLAALNKKLQMDAREESSTNRQFLEKQVAATSDPVIREKILTMIAMEIEKEMLVGSQSIEVLRKPTVAMFRTSPKRKNILIMSFAAGLCLSVISVYAFPLLRSLAKRPS